MTILVILLVMWLPGSGHAIHSLRVHYYEKSRTHLVPTKDTPEPRAVGRPENGRIVAIPQVGGLHHRYERAAGLSRHYIWRLSSPRPTLGVEFSGKK